MGIDNANLLDESQDGERYRIAYRELIRQVWTVVYPEDEEQAYTIAADIVQFEMSLANISMSPERQQNKSLLYNPTSLYDLNILTSNLTRPERVLEYSDFFYTH